jgi:hypothetical protein
MREAARAEEFHHQTERHRREAADCIRPTCYFQNQSPGADKEANWLPVPKGPFNLTMRLYAPKSDALTGKWNSPPVIKAAAR